jgi:hypothetical protein
LVTGSRWVPDTKTDCPLTIGCNITMTLREMLYTYSQGMLVKSSTARTHTHARTHAHTDRATYLLTNTFQNLYVVLYAPNKVGTQTMV